MSNRLIIAIALSCILWPQLSWSQGLDAVEARDMRAKLETSAESGAILWLLGSETDPQLISVKPVWQAVREVSRPAAAGDGVWVELLTARLELLGRFPTAFPAPGEHCALIVPVLQGTWWALLVRREGNETEVVARYQVGADLTRVPGEFDPIVR